MLMRMMMMMMTTTRMIDTDIDDQIVAACAGSEIVCRPSLTMWIAAIRRYCKGSQHSVERTVLESS
jgi:hypothetical protein